MRVSSTELTWVESIYFSFVTITTLGFGDILPSNDLGMIMVSSEAVLGILLIGLFLNSLSNRLGRRIREKEIEIECNRKEQLRKSLEKHVSILLINFETGDPFSWSDSADDLPSPSDYESQLHDLRKFLDVDKNISDLNVKMLLETCDQHYEILISLTSAAAEISSVHLMRWSSLLVSVKTLKDSYDKIKSDEKYGQFSWPEFGLIRKDVSRIISVAEFLRVGNSI